MLGFRDEGFTPCPSRSRASRPSEGQESSFFNIFLDEQASGDDTENLEFTTEIQGSTLIETRPRRSTRSMLVDNRGNVDKVGVHPAIEVGCHKRKISSAESRDISHPRPSLLAQPAQRFRKNVDRGLKTSSQTTLPKTNSRSVPRAADVHPIDPPNSTSLHSGYPCFSNSPKPSRQGNISRGRHPVPPTTQAPRVLGDSSSLPKMSVMKSPAQAVGKLRSRGSESDGKKKRVPKPSAVLVPKLPLQPSTKITQQPAIAVDIPGRNGGKENIPPGALLEEMEEKRLFSIQAKPRRLDTAAPTAMRPRTTKVVEKTLPMAQSLAVGAETPRSIESVGVEHVSMRALSSSITSDRPQPWVLQGASSSLDARANAVLWNCQGKASSMNAESCRPTRTKSLSTPAACEEVLFSRQETVITQLLNSLFQPATKGSDTASVDKLPQIDDGKSYISRELQGYNYAIQNLAVDLRDGVRLTRLVEILLFTSTRRHSLACVKLGTFATLQDMLANSLSKRLRFPCISRSAKLHNVRIALSALRSARIATPVMKDLRADDIVDGFKEKTIALLWALINPWGLANLLDLQDLRTEIGRLERKAVLNEGPCLTPKVSLDELDPPKLLGRWAMILAATEGLEVGDTVTSLPEGQVYERILVEYEPFVVNKEFPGGNYEAKSSDSMHLASRAQLLGCSPHLGEPHLFFTSDRPFN